MSCLGLGKENECIINNDVVLTTSSESRRGASALATIFLMVNTTLGAGLLNFPLAFDAAGGIAIAVIMQLSFLVFITGALVVLADCSDATNTSSMQDTLAGLCGPKSLKLCSLFVTIYSFGCCITFLIIIGDQFDRILTTIYGVEFCNYWYLSRAFTTAISCSLFILPLCFSKRLEILSYVSSIGCVTVIYVIWLIIYKSYTPIDHPVKPMRTWPDHWTQVFHIVPVVCFGYQCHMSAIPTYACMKDRRLGKFTICATISMLVCFLAYTIVGIFGYRTFGSGAVPGDILQGYSGGGSIVTIALVAVTLKNFTTYPVILFCGREALLGLCSERVQNILLPRIVLTLVWFSLSLFVAILVPDISPVINLMGSLSAAFIFLFPGVCLLQNTLIKDPRLFLNKNKALVVLAAFVMALGTFVCGVVLVESLQDLGREPSQPPLVTGFRIVPRTSIGIRNND